LNGFSQLRKRYLKQPERQGGAATQRASSGQLLLTFVMGSLAVMQWNDSRACYNQYQELFWQGNQAVN